MKMPKLGIHPEGAVFVSFIFIPACKEFPSQRKDFDLILKASDKNIQTLGLSSLGDYSDAELYDELLDVRDDHKRISEDLTYESMSLTGEERDLHGDNLKILNSIEISPKMGRLKTKSDLKYSIPRRRSFSVKLPLTLGQQLGRNYTRTML